MSCGADGFKTLTDLRFFNIANAPRGAIKYGQSLLDMGDVEAMIAEGARDGGR